MPRQGGSGDDLTAVRASVVRFVLGNPPNAVEYVWRRVKGCSYIIISFFGGIPVANRVQAPNVKAAVHEIVSKQGDKPISVEIIAQLLRSEYADAISSDLDDLISYGIGVAIGRISSRPVQDIEVRDLFGGGSTHELVSLRGGNGGKVHISQVTAPLWVQQPTRPQKAVDVHKTQDEVFDAAAREMISMGISSHVPIIEYLKAKKS